MFSFVVGLICLLNVSTRSTGPLHHSSQLLFMLTPFNQQWSVAIITNNSTNFMNSGCNSEILLLFCSLYCFFFFYPSNPEHCQWCASKAAVKIHMGIITFANVVGRMLCIHPCLSVCLFVCLSVCLFVCLFVCLSVSRITQKVMDGFERNIMRWLPATQGPFH